VVGRWCVGVLCVLPSIGHTHAASPAPAAWWTRLDVQSRLVLDQTLVNGATQGLPIAADGDRTLTVLLLATDGHAPALQDEVAALGGRVRFMDATTGYLRARMSRQALRALATSRHVAIAQLDGLDNVRKMLDERPGKFPYITYEARKAAISISRSSRSRSTPQAQARETSISSTPVSSPAIADALRDVADLADDDMGLGDLRRQHPTFDGRGVTIAIVEALGASADFTDETLRTGLTLDGRSIEKIAGLYSSVHPDTYNAVRDQVVRVRLDATVSSSSPIVVLDGVPYRLPHAGTFRVGELRRHDRFCLLLWEAQTKTVWIDANRNRDFTDDDPLHDANTNAQESSAQRLWTMWTDPQSGAAEPMAVAVDPSAETIDVFILSRGHATMTSAVAAGQAIGFVRGAAPGARLVLVSCGVLASSYLEGLILAARREDVDILSVSHTAQTMPNEPDALEGMLIDRLVARYHKMVVIAAGNQGGAVDAIDATGSRLALTIGSYHSPGVAARLGLRAWDPFALVDPTTSRGPNIAGLADPDLLASNRRLAPENCDEPARVGPLALPRCLALSSGTSSAAPSAAGVIASVISGLKQSHLVASPERLIWALDAGASYLDDVPAHAQGSGVIRADRTWALLQRHDIVVPDLMTKGPIAHVLASGLATPSMGDSLFEREGAWHIGARGSRTVTFTRVSGPPAIQRYALRVRGARDVFAVPSHLDLPLGEPIACPIAIQVPREGVLSARVELVDPASGVIVASRLLTIASAAELDTAAGYRVERSGALGPGQDGVHLVRVPPEAELIEVELHLREGTARLDLHEPWGQRYSHVGADMQPIDWVRQKQAGTYRLLMARPMSGVWSLRVVNDEIGSRAPFEPSAMARYDLRVIAYGMRTAIDGERGAIAVTNAMAPLGAATVACMTTDGGRWRTTLREDEDGIVSSLNVPEGADLLITRASTDASSARVGLSLFHCATGHCYLHASSLPAARSAEIVVRHPAPGPWKVVVSSGPGTPGPLTVTREEAIGLATACAPPDSRESVAAGASWTIPIARRLPSQPHGASLWAIVPDAIAARETETSAGTRESIRNRPPVLGVTLVTPQPDSTAVQRSTSRP
jgi:Subtilase family